MRDVISRELQINIEVDIPSRVSKRLDFNRDQIVWRTVQALGQKFILPQLFQPLTSFRKKSPHFKVSSF
ncbi:MAG: hypothetical protein A2428_06460 [Bdellovibrionales bacterium RIFOXYC1_FULL_54_43]|nr:MAG: hypothetical protein A2428_06460 [Bdellovibrionales bacterium RIFOXYC1_FULL_54_43]OFZ85128.1 MAG: hypothetical protein A2603_07285 [Bdellovibrionales bacterium RIFOXYD1_FULL_55_31]